MFKETGVVVLVVEVGVIVVVVVVNSSRATFEVPKATGEKMLNHFSRKLLRSEGFSFSSPSNAWPYQALKGLRRLFVCLLVEYELMKPFGHSIANLSGIFPPGGFRLTAGEK